MTTIYNDDITFQQAVTFEGGVTSTGAQTFGDGTGSPTLALNKSNAGTATIDLKVGSTVRGRLRLDASENVVLAVHDSDGNALGTLTMLAAGGGVIFSKGVTIGTGGLEIQAGNVKLPLAEYADNAAALGGGLVAGNLYHTAGAVKIVT